MGPIAEETLHRLNGDILFLGVDGFDIQHGFTTPNLLEAKVNRAMMDVARVVVAVCDSSKFAKEFGFAGTPYGDGIRTTAASFMSRAWITPQSSSFG